ncbi:unnamed protein product [marine sediment metagenome]|uniref:Uncharacterized protein n=1 Tax=marine sediment metagenome TaxID=412755 RepID=X1MUD6_9ZZZZ
MLGAILRSDGRSYGEIAKGGFLWGLFIGVIALIISIFAQFTILGITASLISGIIGTILYFILGAGIYDLVNSMINSR